MNEPNYADDHRLDILILGPMGTEPEVAPTVRIKEAVESILNEPESRELLDQNRVNQREIHEPEGQTEQEIIDQVLSLIDMADLAIVDITPNPRTLDRANVFYELALVQSLGIPVILVVDMETAGKVDPQRKASLIPFYVRTSKQCRADSFDLSDLTETLRPSLLEFLDQENRTTSFTNDRVSQFYGLPIIDISAAVGLATGYYYNYFSRLIVGGGFRSVYTEAIREVVYVRPSSLRASYEDDKDRLRQVLDSEGFQLETRNLDQIPTDKMGDIWFDHVRGIVLDIPRAIYQIKRSPRLLSFSRRERNQPSPAAKGAYSQRRFQIENRLLDRVEASLDYLIQEDDRNISRDLIHFTNIESAPELVKRLSS